jgi:hypothetical protein
VKFDHRTVGEQVADRRVETAVGAVAKATLQIRVDQREPAVAYAVDYEQGECAADVVLQTETLGQRQRALERARIGRIAGVELGRADARQRVHQHLVVVQAAGELEGLVAPRDGLRVILDHHPPLGEIGVRHRQLVSSR